MAAGQRRRRRVRRREAQIKRRVLRQSSHHTPRARGFKETAHPEGVLAALISPDERHRTPWATRAAWRLRYPVTGETGAEDRISESRPTTGVASHPRASSRRRAAGSDAAVGVAAVTRATAARAGGRISPEAPTDASTCGPRRDTTTALVNSCRRKSPSVRRRRRRRNTSARRSS